jgi:Cupin-like domain
LDELDPRETPLDFFKPVNLTRYPLFAEVKLLTAELKAGECIFIPAFYWVQTQTKGSDSTVMMNFEFNSHSELLNLLFQAIDKGILEN